MEKRIFSLLLAGAMVVSLTSCGSKDEEEGAEDTPTVIGTAVEVASAERGSMATENTLSGQVIADKSVSVVPMAQGMVSGLEAEVGDTVEEGELLFTIDTSTVTAGYGALTTSYEATKEMTDESIKNAQIAVENAQIQKGNAQLALSNAQIALQSAQNNLYNTQQLFLVGAASQVELTAAFDALSQAEAGVAQAQSAVDQADYGIQQAENGVAQAQASQKSSLAQIQSSMSSMGAQAKNGKVKAPCSGLVTSVSVVNGGFAGGSPAMTIAQDGLTRVSVSVSESIYGKLRVGDTAEVSIPSLLDEPYTAQIAHIDIAANPQTALYEVRLHTPDDLEIPIGTFAEVTFFSDRREDVVRIPTEAILTDNEQKYVYVLDSGRKTASRKDITTGLTGETQTEVTSGLTGTETVVVKGQSYLSDGAAVRVVGEG